MSAAVDTSLVLVIEQDQTKMVWMVLGAMLFVAGGVWLVLGDFSNTWRGALAPFVGWASIVVFGAGAVVFLKQLLNPVTMMLSPDGFRYGRTDGRIIPWIAVMAATQERAAKQSYVMLKLDFVVAGKQQLMLSVQTLKISTEDLLRLVLAYTKAHGYYMQGESSSVAATNHTIPFGRRGTRQ